MSDKHILRLIEWLKKEGYASEEIVQALTYITKAKPDKD